MSTPKPTGILKDMPPKKMSLTRSYAVAQAVFGKGATDAIRKPTGTGLAVAPESRSEDGTAMADSDGGYVLVTPDSADIAVRLPTSVAVKAGDRVIIQYSGFAGQVVGVYGGGDRFEVVVTEHFDELEAAAQQAHSDAAAAQEAANAAAAAALAAHQAAQAATAQAEYELEQALIDERERTEGLYDLRAAREAIIDIEGAGVRVGSDTETFQVYLTATQLAFLQSGTVVSSFTNDAANVTNARVSRTLSVGDTQGEHVGWFDFIYKTSNGNLQVKYRGTA